MRFLFLYLLFAIPFCSFGQEEKLPAALNQYNTTGQKEGAWMVRVPARMGEAAYTEFGRYLSGRKTGTWYTFDAEGQVTAIEGYKNDLKNGEVKYFERGKLICTGHYLGLNPGQDYDTIYVTDPTTLYEHKVVVSTDRGTLRHGNWRYYDAETGRLIREEEWQVDELLSRQQFTMSNADSLYYQQRNKSLPHAKPNSRKPPVRSITR